MKFGKLVLLPTFATANSVFGGYDVGAGRVALAGVVEDIAAIGSKLPADFAGAKAIYQNGEGLTDPTLQKFAKGETGTYTSGATYMAFNSLFGSATMWDDLILASADDTIGDYGGAEKASMRAYGVNKGVLGACIFEALNLLEAALDAGPGAAAQEHVDKAWAVYYGSRDNGGKSAAEVSKKRESTDDFGSGTAIVFGRLHFAFQQAKDALATGGSAATAADAVASIKKMIILTFARATIKYSHNRMKEGTDGYGAGAHMEGDAYYRIFAGVALSFLENDAAAKTKLDAISAKMSYAQAASALTYKDDHCAVKKMVEEMYVDLELDCDMVGVKSSLPACPTTCWANMGGERYFYMPLSDVYSYALITKDVKTMTDLSKGGDMPGAKTLYENGGDSHLKLKDIATTDHGNDPFFKAYETTFGSKKSFDDAIAPALAGTGDMASKGASFKSYVVAKCGITALNMETMTLLTDAKTAAAGGDTSYAATGAAFMWDAAYATFNGVSGGKSVGDISGGVCAKRDNDFADGVQVRKMILKQFQAGKGAITAATFDAAALDAAIAEIQRLVGMTFARATIKYSSRAKPLDTGNYDASYHAEGFCYWRGMAGYFAHKTGDKDTVLEIDALLDLKQNDADIVQPALACDAKKKMETLLPGLGISCEDMGAMTSNMHECDHTCAENIVPATPAPDSRAPLAALGALITAVIYA